MTHHITTVTRCTTIRRSCAFCLSHSSFCMVVCICVLHAMRVESVTTLDGSHARPRSHTISWLHRPRLFLMSSSQMHSITAAILTAQHGVSGGLVHRRHAVGKKATAKAIACHPPSSRAATPPVRKSVAQARPEEGLRPPAGRIRGGRHARGAAADGQVGQDGVVGTASELEKA